jgi:site-specific recombinase XerD
MDLQTLKRQYFEHLEIEKGRSIKTIENYGHYIDRFLTFAKITDPAGITDDMVREFRLWLNRQPSGAKTGGYKETLKKKTQNYYLIALRSFLKYLRKRGVDSLSPERIDLAKVAERDLDLISNADLERLLSAPNGDDVKSLRDRAILELFFSTGLRLSELCALPRELDLNKDEFSVRGKGEKVRVVFLSDTAKNAIRAYLKKGATWMTRYLCVSTLIKDGPFLQIPSVSLPVRLSALSNIMQPKLVFQKMLHRTLFATHSPLTS